MTAWLARRDGAELFGVGLLASFFLVVTAGPLAISIAVSPEALESGAVVLSPPCPTLVQTGEECGSCGLTRGFCAMSRLRLADALAYNRAAPWLYTLFWLIALTSGALVTVTVRLGRRLRDRRPAPHALTTRAAS